MFREMLSIEVHEPPALEIPGIRVKISDYLAISNTPGSLDGFGIASVFPGMSKAQPCLEATFLGHSFLTLLAY